MEIGQAKNVVMILGLSVIFAAVMSLILASLDSTVTEQYPNATEASGVISDGLAGIEGLTGTFGIIGTIAGFSILIGFIGLIGLGGYSAYQQYK